MAFLMDTDWAIDAFAFRARARPAMSRLAPRGIAVSRVTLAEMYDGAYKSVDPDACLIELRHFLNAFRLVEVSDPICQRFGELRSYLRRLGVLIPNFDLLIAATALHHDLTLLTFNRRHFERVPGLRIYQPA